MDSYFAFEFFRKKLENIEAKVDEILKKEKHIMSQLDDLNAAIQAEDVEISDLLSVITKVAADIDKLIASSTSPDLTAQLQAIQSHLASLNTGAQQLKDADSKANPPA